LRRQSSAFVRYCSLELMCTRAPHYATSGNPNPPKRQSHGPNRGAEGGAGNPTFAVGRKARLNLQASPAIKQDMSEAWQLKPSGRTVNWS
jgi:hypothetical protein